MFNRADAADALCDLLGVEWIAAAQDLLEATKHLADDPSAGDVPIVSIDFDSEMTFDASDGADGDHFTHGRGQTKKAILGCELIHRWKYFQIPLKNRTGPPELDI